jgi:hypothetical protein
LAEAAAMGTGGSQNTSAIYEELGLNPTVGAVLGLGIDIIAPPMGGVASAGGKAFNAARAVRAAKATGLLVKAEVGAEAVKAFGNGMRDAWTWRNLGAGAVDDILPGSIRVAAAEDTGKLLGFRTALRDAAEAAGRPLTAPEAKAVFDAHTAEVGVGKWSDDVMKAARERRAMAHLDEVAADVSAIPAQGHYLSGMRTLLSESDDIMDAVRVRPSARGATPIFDTAGAAKLPEPLIRTILNNAAGRSQQVFDVLAQNPNLNAVEQLGQAVAVDAAAVRAAAPSVAAFDALMRASKGFKDYRDLVLISNRFIGTPKAARAALTAAAETPVGRSLSYLTKDIEDGKIAVTYAAPPSGVTPTGRPVPGARTDLPVAVVELTPGEAKGLIADLNGLRAGGFLSDSEHGLAMSYLDRTVNPSVPIQSLRALAEANLDSTISTLGKGVDIERVRFRPTTKPNTLAGRFETAGESTARAGLLTPKEMRSVFDGALTYGKALASSGEQVRPLLDMPPTMERAVAGFYAKAAKSDERIKALLSDLMKEGNGKRPLYGLPLDGPIGPEEALSAVARGLNPADTMAFFDEAARLMMIGSDTKAVRFTAGQFVETSYYSMTDGRYFVGGTGGLAHREYRAIVGQAAMDFSTTGQDVLSAVSNLRARLETFMADPANSSALWRAKGGVVTPADATPNIIGGALYTREVNALQQSVVDTALTEEAVRETFRQAANLSRVGAAFDAQMSGLLGAITGDPRLAALSGEDSLRAMIAASMRARSTGNRSVQDVLVQFMTDKYGVGDINVVDAVLSGNPTLARTMDNIMPLINSAADTALARGGLNMQSVEDTIELTRVLASEDPARFAGIAGTRQMVRGAQVQDALDKFVRDGVQQDVFEAVAQSLPKKAPFFQNAVTGLMTLAKNVGNVRYNAFLYLRGSYHGVNLMTAPVILHATLGAANMPGLTSMLKAGRTMEGARTGVETMTTGTRAAIGGLGGALTGGTLSGGTNMGALIGGAVGTAAGAGKPIGRLAGAADTAIAFRDKVGRIWTYEDLRDVSLRAGIMKTEQQVMFGASSMESLIDEAKRIERLSGRKFPGPVFEALKDMARAPADWANSTDNFWRMSSMIEALAQGKPLSVAQDIAKKSLFDYGSLTEAERAFASRFLIFYTFSRVSTEQMVKMLGSPAGMTRFLRQAALGRDVSAMMYEASGGEDYDVRRFYMNDKQLARVVLDRKTLPGGGEGLTLFPALPSQDAFMTMTGILYQSNPVGMVVGTETGLAQYLDPGLKFLVDAAREKAGSPAMVRRADRLRLMDSRHVALLYDVNATGEAETVFGKLTPVAPTKETAMTYLDQEWQMTPEGYKAYKAMATTAEALGLRSTADYYIPLTRPEELLQMPGKDRALGSVGIPTNLALTPEQAEAATLATQAKRATDAAKAARQAREAALGQEVRTAAEE